MTDDLRRARDRLQETARRADDPVSTDVRSVAAELDELVDGEATADHAVVDGYLNELRQAKQEADEAVEADIDAAIDALSAYRDDVDQA